MEQVKVELVKKLNETLDAQMSTLVMKVPNYSELIDEEKQNVNKYISKIDVYNLKTIDEFGKDEIEKMNSQLDILIGIIRSYNITIEDMYNNLIIYIKEHSSPKEISVFNSLRKLTLLDSNNKQGKRHAKEKDLANTDKIQEKLECIRNKLRINAGKLNIIAGNSEEQYMRVQYQIIALQEVLKRVQEEKSEDEQIVKNNFLLLDKKLQLSTIERKIKCKIDNYTGISINIAIRAEISKLLAQNNEELAIRNNYLINTVYTHTKFIDKLNEMLMYEKQCSKQLFNSKEHNLNGSEIDNKAVDNTIKLVDSLKQVQNEGITTNEAFTQVLEFYKNELTTQLDKNNSKETNYNVEGR